MLKRIPKANKGTSLETEQIEISKYDNAFLEGTKEDERQFKICLGCKRLEIFQDPKTKDKYYKTVAPRLEILRIARDETEEQLKVYWICPVCKNIIVLEWYEDWDTILEALTDMIDGNIATKKTKRIKEMIDNGEFEQLPGYTTSISKSINNR
jgi:hypothetical protein